MNFQHTGCKPAQSAAAKSLNNGAGYRIRTRGPLITNRVSSLKRHGFSVNHRLCHPRESLAIRTGVNLSTPAAVGEVGR